MINKINYFTVSPQVVKANTRSKICIKNRYKIKDEQFKLSGEYFVLMCPILDFEVTDSWAKEQNPFVVVARDGQLNFEFDFQEEQDYMLLFWRKTENGEKRLLLRTSVYALEDDLYSRIPLKGNTHLHSCYSDGLEEPFQHIGAALKAGFNYIALTDHNNYEGSVKAKQYLEQFAPYGIKDVLIVLNGEEFSCNFQPMHIISLGADCAVPEEYYWTEDERPEFSDQSHKLDWIIQKLEILCNYIHTHGGRVVLCHPYWKPINDAVRRDAPGRLMNRLLDTGLVDAIEVVSGTPKGDTIISQEQYLLAAEATARSGNKFAMLGQSDSHVVNSDEAANVFSIRYTIAFCKTFDREGILEAIDNRYTVAVEETDGKCLYYGSLRLVNFCRFLENCYFPVIKDELLLYRKIFELYSTGNAEAAEKLADAVKNTKPFNFESLKG